MVREQLLIITFPKSWNKLSSQNSQTLSKQVPMNSKNPIWPWHKKTKLLHKKKSLKKIAVKIMKSDICIEVNKMKVN